MTGRPSTPLDPRARQELQGALAAARAAERSAAASLAQAQRDRSRAEEIAKRGFLSRAQLEATRTAPDNAEAKNGRAACRERVCRYVMNPVSDVALKNNSETTEKKSDEQ